MHVALFAVKQEDHTHPRYCNVQRCSEQPRHLLLIKIFSLAARRTLSRWASEPALASTWGRDVVCTKTRRA
eukprot:2847417-Prorocentrum_lima.AAC.1